MADISFQEEQTLAPQVSTAPQYSFFTRLVISTGLAHDELGASRVLLGVAALAAVLAVGVFFLGNTTTSSSGVPKVIPPLPPAGPGGTSGGGTTPVGGALHFQ